MKTSTVLIVAGAGVLVLYVLTRKSTPLPAASASGSTSIFGAAGQFLGGILSAGTIKAPSSPGAVTGTSSYSATGVGSTGDSEVAIVRSLDAGGISAYDAQGSADAPVYGIAGLDYP